MIIKLKSLNQISSTRIKSFHQLRRSSSGVTQAQAQIGLVREDPNRRWERRTPLTPNDVKKLNGIKIEVESCDKRVFSDKEYERVSSSFKHNLRNKHSDTLS